MVRITFKEFLQYLLEGPKAVYCDLLVDKYLKYSAEFEEEEEEKNDCTGFFTDAGVCAEFSEYTHSSGTIVFGAIFQIKNNCNYLSMLEFFQKKIQNIGKKQKVVSAEVFVYLNEKGITDELIETSTLACVPQQGVCNTKNIRHLTEADECEIKQVLFSEEDSAIGKVVASAVQSFDWSGDESMLGYWDEDRVLSGVISYNYSETADLASVCQVFVKPSKRGKGIARKLLLCTLSQYRNKYWCYRVASGNIPSVKLAQSCGFQAIGGTVYFDLSKELHL